MENKIKEAISKYLSDVIVLDQQAKVEKDKLSRFLEGNKFLFIQKALLLVSVLEKFGVSPDSYLNENELKIVEEFKFTTEELVSVEDSQVYYADGVLQTLLK
jgi:hypothetical protein